MELQWEDVDEMLTYSRPGKIICILKESRVQSMNNLKLAPSYIRLYDSPRSASDAVQNDLADKISLNWWEKTVILEDSNFKRQ